MERHVVLRCALRLQFWDTRTPNPMLTMQLPERVYCADVVCMSRV